MKILCPHCEREVSATDINQDGYDIYECERDGLRWCFKTGTLIIKK